MKRYISLFEEKEKEVIDFKQLLKLYPKAGNKVSGLIVTKDIPNYNSISASFNDYNILKGIREVPIKFFDSSPKDLFYAKDDFERVEELAQEIDNNGWIDPLIVVIDNADLELPYILEGAHRLGALHVLKKKTIPALVVLDEDNIEIG